LRIQTQIFLVPAGQGLTRWGAEKFRPESAKEKKVNKKERALCGKEQELPADGIITDGCRRARQTNEPAERHRRQGRLQREEGSALAKVLERADGVLRRVARKTSTVTGDTYP